MTVRGLLLDLEGVLYQGDGAIPGASQALEHLQGSGYGLRFLTNTTIRPRREIVERMAAMGFHATAEDIFTPAMAAIGLLRGAGVERVHLAAPASLAEDFTGFELVDEAPEAVVLGDLYRDFTWDRLNGLFAMIEGGARLYALHRNRVSLREAGIALDLGPFVAALEYASGVEAVTVGKPDAAFFGMALASLGLGANQAVMVGDDIEADIGGAQAVGLRAVQVRTGKYTAADDDHPRIRPDARLGSLSDLPAWLEGRA